MDFELRKMTSADIFPMCTILKKIGIDEVKKIINSPELMTLVSDSKGKKDKATAIGMSFILDIASLIVGNIPKIEADLYKFLASMSKMTEKELRDISPADFLDLVIAVIKHEDFKDFFKRASQFLK